MSTHWAVNAWLVLIAVIWGFGFVPQKMGMDYFSPAAFNAWRFALGALTLLPVIAIFVKREPRRLKPAMFSQPVTECAPADAEALLFAEALLIAEAPLIKEKNGQKKGRQENPEQEKESRINTDQVSASQTTVNRPNAAVTRSTLHLGVALGLLLFLGALLQQLALLHTSVANVAFITGLYVIVVPTIGFFLGLRYSAIVWCGGGVAMLGLYLMTGGVGSPSLKGDAIALVGAVMWAAHILLLSRKAGAHPQVSLAAIQFAFCAAFSLAYALCFEGSLLPTEPIGYLWPLLNGTIVVGFAYTLQVMVMDNAEPFAASLILSLEAVFGALAGYWVFDESFTAAALVGAGLMLVGCVLAQKPD